LQNVPPVNIAQAHISLLGNLTELQTKSYAFVASLVLFILFIRKFLAGCENDLLLENDFFDLVVKLAEKIIIIHWFVNVHY
jgi:hypothetical protein